MGPPLLGTMEDVLKKASGTGTSIRAHLQLRRTWNLEGGSYTGEFERCMKEGSSNRSSLSEGLHEGGPGGRAPLLGTPKDMLCKALEMCVCFKRGPAFGEHSGVLFS